MTSRFLCLSALSLAFCASPVLAQDGVTQKPAASATASSQVQITKKDGNEKVVGAQTIEVNRAISLAAQLAPGAVSRDINAVKTLVIIY